MSPELSSETVNFLLSDAAQASLAEMRQMDLAPDGHLALLMDLRKRFTPEEAAGLLTQVQLRQRARAKFSQVERLYFTPEALEQATAEPIARYRAEWIHRQAPPGPVLDLGCGIGADTLALARHRTVIAYETAPDRLRLAQANASALGLGERIDFRLADWTTELGEGRMPQAAAAFADPARRIDGRRVFHLSQMQPPLEALLALQAQIPHLGVKVAPGVQDDELPEECGVEFVSHEGTCKEAILWFGALRFGPSKPEKKGNKGRRPARRAAVYDGQNDQRQKWSILEAQDRPPPLGPLEPGQMLYEPDPAVIRAGPFAELCQMLGAHLFDSQIAYLVGPPRSLPPDAGPFVQRIAIDEVLPGGLKGLNQRLKARGIGTVELKKRAFPVEPESLRPRLKLTPGGPSAVIIFTLYREERVILLGHRPQEQL